MTKTPTARRAAGRKPGDESELCGPLERKQVLVDDHSHSILTKIGGGELSLGIREAARRLLKLGKTEPFAGSK